MFSVDSAAIGSHNMALVKEFIREVTSSFEIGESRVLASVISTECIATNDFDLSKNLNRQALMNTLSNNETSQYSDLMRKVRMYGFSPSSGARFGAKKISVLFLTGVISDIRSVLKEVARYKFRKIHKIVIGVSSVDKAQAMKIANKPLDDNYFVANSFRDLSAISAELKQRLCQILSF